MTSTRAQSGGPIGWEGKNAPEEWKFMHNGPRARARSHTALEGDPGTKKDAVQNTPLQKGTQV